MLIALFWLGDQFGMLAFIDNFGKGNDAEIAKVQKQIGIAEDIVMKGADASELLTAFEQRSLPYNPDLARSRYQSWLTNLFVEQHSFAQASVEVGMPAVVTVKDGGKKTEAYRRYGFTLSGSGTLEQITQFLFEFYNAGHLHKISSISMTRGSAGRFSVSIAGEAIGVSTTDRESDLSTLAENRLAHPEVADYASIVRRNIFSREVGATLKLISVSSVTYDRSGSPEAWFKVGPQQQTRKLQRGATFDVSVHRIEVIDIQPRSVLVDVDGTVVDLPLGKTLHEVLSLTDVAAG